MRIRWPKLFFCFLLLCAFPLCAQQTEPNLAPGPTEFPSATAMLEGRAIWNIKLPLKGNSPEVRATNIETRLKAFAKDYSVPVDHIKVVDSEISTDIAADYSILILFTSEDAAAEGISRVALAQKVLPKVKQAVIYYRE